MRWMGIDRKKRGAVLIFALWLISFLAVLAVNIAVGIRHKIIMLKRLEHRQQLLTVTEAGVKKAIAVLMDDIGRNQFQYTAVGKMIRHNNPEQLQNIQLGEDFCEVSYAAKDATFFGMVDEEGKININVAGKPVLKNIIGLALHVNADQAQNLAEAILDWRQFGQSQITGFYSDDYYANLEFPYPEKKDQYELMDELLLIRGIDGPMFEQLSQFVTVYGDGRVNINTASKEVLTALGMAEPLVDKILTVRRGPDGVENTGDDHVFLKTFDIAAEVGAVIKLEANDIQQIDQFNARGWLATSSYFYTMRSTGHLLNTSEEKSIRCVFNTLASRIEYWYEK